MPFDTRNRLIENRERPALIRELAKIENVERSDIRMLETSRNRLRARLKRFEVPQLSSGSDAVDVRMYDTHNPGFCYHCTGAIRASNKTPRRNVVDVFEEVRSMLFTDGEVDPDKVLCLHVLAAHYAESGPNELSDLRPITPLIEEGKKESFSGAWNHILPCYVVDVRRNVDDVTDLLDEVKRHEDPLVKEAEDEVVNDFRSRYEKYLNENSDVDLALSKDNKRATMVPNRIGKVAIIPPHIYSLLGAAQELKIKQAIAEESRRKKFRRSSSSIRNIDDQSISFRLENDEDAISARPTTATPNRGWTSRRIADASKVFGFQSLSRRSTTFSHTTDPCSITTLSRATPRSSEFSPLLGDLRNDPQIVTIKPSNRTMGRKVSESSSTKSPFCDFSNTLHRPGSFCANSITSGTFSSLGEPRKIRRPIFLNSPLKSPELSTMDCKTVPILVNNQMQALVHSVLDVLEHVNPSKVRKIVSTANSPYEIRKMLVRPDIQLFIDSLAGQPLISSPNSFVTSVASILREIDPRIESSIEKELVATTLAVPPVPGLHRFVEEIRSNLFVDPDQTGRRRQAETTNVETFGSQRRKLLEYKPVVVNEELNGKRDTVFDVETMCLHSDVQGNKMTCACCYAKWKDSLPDSERSLVPDFSYLSCHASELRPKNATEIDADHCRETELDFNEESIDREGRLTAETNPKRRKVPVVRLKTSARSLLMKTARNRSTTVRKLTGESIDDGAKLSGLKTPVEKARSRTDLQPRDSEITLKDEVSLTKCQFKPWKVSRDPSYLDPDRIILRRMTNPQRILVGQMCASIKTRKINMEGIMKERTPLAALIAPVLSNESLRVLTQGTRQPTSKTRKAKVTGKKEELPATIPEKLSGPILAKIRQAVAESETELRLKRFLKTRI